MLCKGTTLFVERIVLDSGESVCLGSGWRSIPTRWYSQYRWPDIVCLEVYTFLLCPKIVPKKKTNYEIPWPSLLVYKRALNVTNRILGIKGQVSQDL